MSENSLSPEELARIKGDFDEYPPILPSVLQTAGLLATIKAYRTALIDAWEYADHAPGCSGGVKVGGRYPYSCRCGFGDWVKEAKELIGE